MIIDDIFDKAKETISLTGVSPAELEMWAQKIICILGPSGVGKTALCQALINMPPNLFYLLGSTITRHKSPADIASNNYHHVPEDVFLRMVSEEAFLSWQKTRSGYYGIEKQRIREIISTQKIMLAVYRSQGGGVLKTILPGLMVLELRSPIEMIATRIKNRSRLEIKPLSVKLETAIKDMATNEAMFRYWHEKLDGNWHQIQNNKHEPPIAEEVVTIVFKIIMAKQHGFDSIPQ